MYRLAQWINWRLVPRAGDSKPAKVPFDIATGLEIDAHDPKNWLPFELASALDPAHVGFVLTANDPYFCIDLDHHWNGATWRPETADILARFPGAYTEISFSGDGLHIIGQGIPASGYKTRGVPGLGIEFYYQKRFIAITGRMAQGSADIDFTGALHSFAPLYLQLDVPTGPVMGWTAEAVAEAKPIDDDDKLIEKMLAAKPSAGVAFGGKASAADLWNANQSALVDAFPGDDGGYDESRVDGALAGHLAFWTGKNCERILRLMRRSKLVRPKWERADYLPRTILGACQRLTRVYTGPQSAPTDALETAGAVRTGYQYLDVSAQQKYFAGCVHIVKGRRVLTPRGILTPDEFSDHYGKYEFQISTDGGKPTKNAYEAFTRNRAVNFPWADHACFRPEHPPCALIDDAGRVLVNTYRPAPVVLGNGDVAPFLDLLQRIMPDRTDREILLSYLAALRQHPGAKFQWAPLLQGIEGNGKSAILSCAEYAVGSMYTHKPSSKELGDSGAKFTGWLQNKLLIIVEEIYVSDRREVTDFLKTLITEDRVEIQGKGLDQVTGDNRANFLLTSNHRDAIIKTRGDRRYAVFYTAQQEPGDLERAGMTGDYFPRLYRWLRGGGFADVAGFLQRYTIADELNPATHCHRAPATSSTEAAIVESRGVIEQAILEAVDEGRQGFCGGWISSVCLSRLFAELRRNIAPKKRSALLASLGYVPHPALSGRGVASINIMQEDMKRPVLYVKSDSLAHNFMDANEATHNYIKSQGYTGSGIRVI